MNKIPTAKELIFSILGEVKCDSEVGYLKTEEGKEILDYLIEEVNSRTKLYVTAALKAASEQADLIETDGDIDPKTILNAYPLTNIK